MMTLCLCAALHAPDAIPVPFQFVPWMQPSLGPYKKDNEQPKKEEIRFLVEFLIFPLKVDHRTQGIVRRWMYRAI